LPTVNNILNPTSEFAIGFYLGLVFLIIAVYHLFRLRGELARFRRHLSDKLEIEAETMKKVKTDQETLRRENESLRIKVNALNELPDRKLQRDLEIYARAEKKMLIQVPGFAPAWETAKAESHTELMEEESGRSAPRRIFSRLFGGGGSSNNQALPARAEAPTTASHPADSEFISGKATVAETAGAGNQ
jgi:cell division protein FtsB